MNCSDSVMFHFAIIHVYDCIKGIDVASMLCVKYIIFIYFKM